MKTIFIETKRKFKDSEIKYNLLDSLEGETIALAATIQYIDIVPKVKSYLESKGKKVIIKQGAFHKAHVLGCNSTALDKSADTILIGPDGTPLKRFGSVAQPKDIEPYIVKLLEKND